MSNEQLLALADEIGGARLLFDSDRRHIADQLRALATPSPQADKARGEGEEMPTMPTLRGFRGLHPDTLGLVRRFAYALACKLSAAEEKYGYSDGWARPDWMDECRANLLDHVQKGDPRDVAAYCAFLWHHGESTAPQPQGDASLQRDRESDRRRFSDPAFNRWLDDGISDAGHTVWDAVGDVTAAWAGWEARQFAGDAVLIAECCGREECGGECGNEWLGMGLYRKPAEEAATQAPGGGELPQAFRDIRGWMEHCVSAADEGVDYAVPRDVLDALTALRLMEKVGRNRWAPTTLGEEVASYALSATHTQATAKQTYCMACEYEGPDTGGPCPRCDAPRGRPIAPQARPDGGEARLTALRAAQAEAVMPLIGPLLDAWEGASNDDKEALRETGIARHIEAVNEMMENHPDPVPASDVARLVDAASAVKSALAFGACPADKQIDLAESLAPFTTDKKRGSDGESVPAVREDDPGEFGAGIKPNPKARYWQERSDFWREQAMLLGFDPELAAYVDAALHHRGDSRGGEAKEV